MNQTISPELQQFAAKPWWYTTRGFMMILCGGGVAVFCIIAPDVQMLSTDLSWLPLAGFIVILVGLLRCIDGVKATSLQGFILNMQGGVLDIVVGSLILFSIGDEPTRLSFLIAGYLITQGLLRNILLIVVKIDNPISSRITGFISIVLGILVWLDWPISAAWFLAFSLCVDINFRGWALLILASSMRSGAAKNEQQ